MGYIGKLVAAIEFKAGEDVFHELTRHKPHQLSTTSPEKVQACDVDEGEYGRVGSIILWRYTLDGKKKIAKQRIEAMDEEKKMIKYRTLEGDLMEEYKDFAVSIHIEKTGDVDLLTWTLDYEMLNEEVGHPISLLSYFIDLTKDVDAHHIAKP